MTDWSACKLVARRPGILSGQPALRDDPRVSPDTIVENMDLGEDAQAVIDNFGLRTPLRDVLAVYDYARAQLVPRSA